MARGCLAISGPAVQEGLQHGMAMFAFDGFEVELHALNAEFAVAQAHDLAVFRPGRNLEAVSALM